MSVRVRMAPSPTGFLHIGNVRTALFNWLFARHEGGEFRLRIENTDTSREVDEATEQIQESLRWLGLDWDGEVTFQLDRLDDCAEIARRLVEEGKAYEDEGAIRFRMPDEGVTAWDDAVRGRVEFPNDQLEDVVLVRSDGRPTYNFASPMEDVWDEITHVIRGEDHISNTPKQINIIRAIGAEPPAYAHVSHVLGADGKSLSKRHGSVTVDEFRHAGYYAPALINFLALLGWSYDDKTTIMSRDELVERFGLFPDFAGFLFRDVEPDRSLLDGRAAVVEAARQALEGVEPFEAAKIEAALRDLAEELELSPRKAFEPIRIAVTGSKISPGLFESIELLGKDETLKRLTAAAAAVEA